MPTVFISFSSDDPERDQSELRDFIEKSLKFQTSPNPPPGETYAAGLPGHVFIHIPAGTVAAVSGFIKIVEYVKKWRKKKKRKVARIEIYGPDGRVVKIVEGEEENRR